MTELALSIAENVIKKLGSLAYQEICMSQDIASNLTKFQLTMSTIQAVLMDAEEKQVRNRALSVWLEQLKDVFYDAIDVLDEFVCEDLRRKVVETYGNTSEQVLHSVLYSSFNPLGFRFKMGHRIKKIIERLEEIAKVRAQFYLNERLDDKSIGQREREMTHSFLCDSNVIGRADDKQKIVDLLMRPNEDNNAFVIAIVGIGGMGKTTLAQWVYNDERIARNFDTRIWVCVSDDFNILKLAKEILKCAGGRISENMTMDEVQVSLRNTLNEKNFFIVLDDVWNDDRSKWIDLKNLLIGGAKRSKIVVTTRIQEVALMMASGPIHNLKGLSEDDCLSLFLMWAFKEGEKQQYPTLIEIGKEIVTKSKGVPLAVKTLGGLLYSKFDDRDWIFIRDNEIWKLEQKENDILPALRLSYDQLPSSLKQCFAYCSLYPKDHIYFSDELIQSWMANGLLHKSNESPQELEDIGLQYVKELFSRSLFQEFSDFGYCYIFKMHDLVHDLSLFVAQSDHCLVENTNNRKNYEKVRHVSILDYNLGANELTTFLHKLNNSARTIIFRNEDVDPINVNESFFKTCISRFKYLRLLDLRFLRFEVLPSSIGSLKHLRYLRLRRNKQIKKLPNSICDMQNLETLILDGCGGLEELPRDIRKMISLRYLWITTKQSRLLENGIECLYSLRTMIFYKCLKLESLPEGIQCLTSLRRLEFTSCESLMSLPRGLKYLIELESLIIFDCGKLNLMEGEDYPTSLRSLRIGSLPQLVALPQWLIRFGNTLQVLIIHFFENLEALPEWFPYLISLRKLVIWACPKLSSLPERMDCLTSLKELEIGYCLQLRRNCKRDVGKDWPKIAHVPLLKIV